MSSNPIDLAARPPTVADRQARTPDPRTDDQWPVTARIDGHAKRPGWLKRILPRTLFGRSVVILVTPLIVVQAVATSVFYDRLVDTLMRRLSGSVAGEIELVIETRHLLPRDGDQAIYLAFANTATDLGLAFRRGAALSDTPRPPTGTLVEEQLKAALIDRLNRPFQIDERSQSRDVKVAVALPDGVLDVTIPRKRLFLSPTYIFLMWMFGTAIFMTALATWFMRNQVKSLRRLAIAADAFGKGQDVPNFKPEGAAEVRQTAAAFLVMRERIQRQISQRTEMLAGVSHDLRTPLTRMKLELELLGEQIEVAELKSDVAEMQQMVEGYLDFARGADAESPRETDLIELVEDAVANARRDGTQVSLSGPNELPFAVRPDGLRRCLMNLIGNAGRYGGHVWVAVLDRRNGVAVIIDDDGPGIPEAMREAVFRPFFRLERSRNLQTGGVGLGLTIARDIVRSHGGELILETSPQGGLRAHLRLPR
ncbi:MAG TPA: ATP-binding protein [Stellaceae bacterium]|nr:ATP-binding protein [Stellaceae bacterium]